MNQKGELPPIKYKDLADALLRSIDTLLPKWLPAGVREGEDWKCGDLSGSSGRSLCICMVGERAGRWFDHATGEKGGDLLSLYAAIHDLSMPKAALAVAAEERLEDVAGIVRRGNSPVPPPRPPAPPAPPAAPAKEKEKWRTLVPVPAVAPKPNFSHHNYPDSARQHIAEYRVGDVLYGYVVRFLRSCGVEKVTMPYVFAQSERNGSMKWVFKGFVEPKPLYFPLGNLPVDGQTVVLVEGEKKADVLQTTLDAFAPGTYVVASWVGGSGGWSKCSWDWLPAFCPVLLWPDCDSHREKPSRKELNALKTEEERQALKDAQPYLKPDQQPGMQAMLGIGRLLRERGLAVQLLPVPFPGVKVSGWDCRDYIETDGWTGEHIVTSFFAKAYVPGWDAEPAATAKKRESPVTTSGGGNGSSGSAVQAGADDSDGGLPWWLRPYWDSEKDRWMVSRKLVIAALEHDKAVCDVLGYNELTNSVQCREAWPWKYAKPGDVRGADSLLLGKYLTDTYGLPSIPKAALEEAIQTVAYTKRFHPIRDWLLELEWDGKPRLDKWLIHTLGESPDSLRPKLMEYLTLVGRYWLLGMVARVMEPGCKFDYMPVLEGEGGLRKSTLVETLASSSYFSDTPFDVSRGKEGQEQVQGLWIYEIAELTHFSKAEVGAIKAFVSSKVDRFRVAYGAVVEAFPRQCVLAGTTNEDTYLRDRTGNRRFWPIPVRNVINTEWVAKARAQLFAEAFALYQQGERYNPLPEEEERLFKPMQESRLVETAVESELLMVLMRESLQHGSAAVVNKLTEFVTIAQLTTALGQDAAKATPGLQAQITSWLKHEGWERKKRQINGVRAWGFERPRNWPSDGAAVGLDQEDGSADLSTDVPALAEAGAQMPTPSPAAAFLDAQDGMNAPF
ncbi:VapE domain-containing protein [Comamonas sp.]|uniref:VapE domain-containing protein n=1 Tax=Comamonas sp. TaxID=34028 RepID=UPI003D097801